MITQYPQSGLDLPLPEPEEGPGPRQHPPHHYELPRGHGADQDFQADPAHCRSSMKLIGVKGIMHTGRHFVLRRSCARTSGRVIHAILARK